MPRPNGRKLARYKKLVTAFVLLAYVLWAGIFIYKSSFLAIDGQRYFSLVDDAMISMRYAWNFSHGLGLVWNPGQYVEGYSNLLMVLVMSAAIVLFGKIHAVLAIQIFGLGLVLAVGMLSSATLRLLRPGSDDDWLDVLALACVLAYYPLSYWSLQGMETGLLTLLLLGTVFFAFKWQAEKQTRQMAGAILLAGLAFLTRQDSIVPASLIFVFLFVDFERLRKKQLFLSPHTWMVVIYILFVAGQTAFRVLYYGEWLPNTYLLKVSGVPLTARLYGGMVFIGPFLLQSALLLAFSGLGLMWRPQKEKSLLFFILAALTGYQIWVGGDAWPVWRMLTPGIPLVIILALLGFRQLTGRSQSTSLTKNFGVVLALAGVLMISVNVVFWQDMAFAGNSLTAKTIASRRNHVNAAIAIQHLTTETARVGVFWAGIVPYFTERTGVDFLGKSDRHIAGLAPDLSGDIGWNGIINTPGHVKYDLVYSIDQLQPAYIEGFRWGKQDLSAEANRDYVRANYQDVAGSVVILLRKDSPDVLWDQVRLEP